MPPPLSPRDGDALGHEVLAVTNGREVLETLERTPVDLILMDCQMPEIDGYEATRRIRLGAGQSRGVPIVALTAHAMREELEKCLAVGMNDYITKPFREEVLRQKLQLWLADGEKAEPQRPPAGMPRPSSTAPLFDGKKLSELRRMGRDLGQDVLRDLTAIFRSQTQLAQMRSGLLRGDRPGVSQQAHSLKGSSAAVGALRLVALCAELEELPAGTSDEVCARRLDDIEEEYQRVLSGLAAAAADEA